MRNARTVFRGTITALRAAPDGDKIATFRVTRVWKGGASETLEMPMLYIECYNVGVPAAVEIGAEMLIFAGATVNSNNGLREWQLVTSEFGIQRLRDLGPGRPPRSSH
jgi:hypothetical protein